MLSVALEIQGKSASSQRRQSYNTHTYTGICLLTHYSLSRPSSDLPRNIFFFFAIGKAVGKLVRRRASGETSRESSINDGKFMNPREARASSHSQSGPWIWITFPVRGCARQRRPGRDELLSLPRSSRTPIVFAHLVVGESRVNWRSPTSNGIARWDGNATRECPWNAEK